ncbi:MAG TPA: protein kinase family protein [Niallia sp.]|nr:protein kinase family protein [Niallia sp.]
MVNKYEQLAEYVYKRLKKNESNQNSTHLKLTFIGKGATAYVYKIAHTSFVLKVFLPKYAYLAEEEGKMYERLKGIPYYPSVHEIGAYYIVIDYIEGTTLFECLMKGIRVKELWIKEVDRAILLGIERGVNPSDIHLKNIILTTNEEIKLIDLARFGQKEKCRKWSDLKHVYYKIYCKPYFPIKINSVILDSIRIIYKHIFLKIVK